jgi:Spy/CpxP family protein refolding chaperone
MSHRGLMGPSWLSAFRPAEHAAARAVPRFQDFRPATHAYNMCFISCMSVKSLLRAAPMLLLCATLSTAPAANAASPAASPSASITSKHKLSPDAVKAARLKRLKNQVDLTADQEAKAKPIIDKYVDDRQAAKGDHAQLVALKTKFDADINAILTPDQQKKLAASKSAAAEKLKAARAAKAAASPSASPSPAKSN